MVLPHGYGDLYHKYRPLRFEEIAGHKEVVKSIRRAITAEQPSQAYLLLGESGTGKTTTARIMALSLNCEDPAKGGEPCLQCKSCKAVLSGKAVDITEVNAADHRGIGDIRQLCQGMSHMPMQLKNKVYILDEAHQLTSDAQSSLLKELEEAPKHVFIILCSTHPKKLLPTVKNRCQKFKFSSLRRAAMLKLIEEVATLEGEDYPPKVYQAVTDAAGGSPRGALVLLQQVIQLGSKDLSAVLRLLEDEEHEDPSAIALCIALSRGNPRWTNLVELYKEAVHLGPPAVGMIMAGFFRNKLLKASSQAQASKLHEVLGLFTVPFPDGKLGQNQLVFNLYKAYEALKQ